MTIFKFNKESYFYNELPGIVIITAIGQLQAGAVQNQTAAVFGVSTSTISKLKAKYNRECQRPTSKWAHFLSLSAFTIFRQSATDSQSRFSRALPDGSLHIQSLPCTVCIVISKMHWNQNMLERYVLQ